MNPTIERETQARNHNELIAAIKQLVEKVDQLEKEVIKLQKKTKEQ